jgi:microcin C transport system substrate-binding protein
MNRQLFFNQYRTLLLVLHQLRARGGGPTLCRRAGAARTLPRYVARGGVRRGDPPRRPPAAPRSLRENLREARALLEQAGWTYRDGALRNARGEPFEFEIINDKRTWERIIAPFARNLEKLGIRAKLEHGHVAAREAAGRLRLRHGHQLVAVVAAARATS